jgi:hypothetical protein
LVPNGLRDHETTDQILALFGRDNTDRPSNDHQLTMVPLFWSIRGRKALGHFKLQLSIEVFNVPRQEKKSTILERVILLILIEKHS